MTWIQKVSEKSRKKLLLLFVLIEKAGMVAKNGRIEQLFQMQQTFSVSGLSLV